MSEHEREVVRRTVPKGQSWDMGFDQGWEAGHSRGKKAAAELAEAQLQRIRESADKLAYFLEQAAEHLPWYTKRDPDSERAQAFEWFAGDAQRALVAYRSTTEGERDG